MIPFIFPGTTLSTASSKHHMQMDRCPYFSGLSYSSAKSRPHSGQWGSAGPKVVVVPPVPRHLPAPASEYKIPPPTGLPVGTVPALVTPITPTDDAPKLVMLPKT